MPPARSKRGCGRPPTPANLPQETWLRLRGQVSRYQDKLQINVDRIRSAAADEFDLGDFVPKTARDVDELWAELNAYVASFTNPHLQALLRAFLDDPKRLHQLCKKPLPPRSCTTHGSAACSSISFRCSASADLAARHYRGQSRPVADRRASCTISASSQSCAGAPASITRSKASSLATSPSALA